MKLLGISNTPQYSIKFNTDPLLITDPLQLHKLNTHDSFVTDWFKVLDKVFYSSFSSLHIWWVNLTFARPSSKKQDALIQNPPPHMRKSFLSKGAKYQSDIYMPLYDWFTKLLPYNLWVETLVQERLGSKTGGESACGLFQTQFLRLTGTVIGESLNEKVQSYKYQWSVFFLVDRNEQLQESCWTV